MSSLGMSRYPEGQGYEAAVATWSDLGTRKVTWVVGMETGGGRGGDGWSRSRGAHLRSLHWTVLPRACLACSHPHLPLKSLSPRRPLDHRVQPLHYTPTPLIPSPTFSLSTVLMAT